MPAFKRKRKTPAKKFSGKKKAFRGKRQVAQKKRSPLKLRRSYAKVSMKKKHYGRPKRSYLKGKRRAGKQTGNSLYSAPSFGMAPQKVGGKVVRVYEFDPITQGNNGAAVTAFGLGLRIASPTTNTFTMRLYLGRPISGTGTQVSEQVDFGVDAPHFMDTFKWFKVNKMEVMFIPLVSQINDLATNPNDIVGDADPGVVAIAHWNGDTEVVAPTTGAGLAASFTDFRRDNAHITFRPIGKKSVNYACHLNAVELDDSQYGTDRLQFPKAAPLQTESMRAAATEYPYYGYQFWWDHPYLAAVANKFRFTMRVRVEVQWNTVQDSSLTSLEKEEIKERHKLDVEAALLGQESTLQPANPNAPRVVFPEHANEEKKMAAACDAGYAEDQETDYVMDDLQHKVKMTHFPTPANSPRANQQSALPPPQPLLRRDAAVKKPASR